MHAIKSLITLSALALGASAYVLNPAHSVERDVALRRHANIAARAPVANANANTNTSNVLFSRAQRRSARQKRCISQGGTPTDNDNETPTDPNPPATTTTSTGDNGNGNGNGGGSGGSSGGSSGGDTFTGQLTYYATGLGACGWTNNDGEMIAAASQLLYDGFDGYWGGNPNNNPICGKQAVITYQGKTITVTLVDRCEGCAKYDLDLSPSAFSQLADQGLGRLDGATWHFL